MANQPTAFQFNEVLKTIKSPPGWKGTPINAKGQFQNLHHPFIPSWLDVMRWKLFMKNPYSEFKKSEVWKPVIMQDDSWLKATDDVIVWLGHLTCSTRGWQSNPPRTQSD